MIAFADRDCGLCPRLADFRKANRLAHPEWFNAPVPSFGAADARLLVVGMAPGLRGANRTGRPFTGDHAGMLLYETLIRFGFAHGRYGADAADGVVLADCRIANAVRCVPPKNLPEPAEARTCNPFLAVELAGMPELRIVLALGLLSHAAILRSQGVPASRHRFAHGAIHDLPNGKKLANSYHVSRYNQNTGRLTVSMFEQVVADIRALLPISAA
jgi:uracil-DNA glycosylase family 4